MYSVEQPATASTREVLPDQPAAAKASNAPALELSTSNPAVGGRRLWKALASQFASALSSRAVAGSEATAGEEQLPLQERAGGQIGSGEKPGVPQPGAERKVTGGFGRNDRAVLDAERQELLKKVKGSVQRLRMESCNENAKTRVIARKVPPEGTRILRKGARELSSLLEGWERDQGEVPEAPANGDDNSFSGRKRRRTALVAAHKVQQALDDSGHLKELASKRAARVADEAGPSADSALTPTGRPRRAAAEDCLARTAALAMEADFSEFAEPARARAPSAPRERSVEPTRAPHSCLPPIPAATDPLNLPPDVLEMMANVFREQGDRRWACRRILRTGILAGQLVEYRKQPHGPALLKGTMTEMGYVQCFCSQCNGHAELSPLTFEEHAGSGNRKPLDHMFLAGTGMSIKAFCMQGSNYQAHPAGGQRLQQWTPAADPPKKRPPKTLSGGASRVKMGAPTPKGSRRTPIVRNNNKNKRLFIYGSGADLKDGELVSYLSSTGGPVLVTGTIVIRPNEVCGIRPHNSDEIISASQFERLAGCGQRRAPYDNIVTSKGETLREIAARMPDDVDYSKLKCTFIASGRRRGRGGASAAADNDFGEPQIIGGCSICDETDFTPSSEGFGDRTIIICDQCELEYHVGCLRKEGRCDLQALPEGKWFCCSGCVQVNGVLQEQLAKGPQRIASDERELEWVVRHSSEGGAAPEGIQSDIQIVREMLEESFDPIIDMKSNTDLLPIMCASGSHFEWDYSGMHCILMRAGGIPVVAAVIRVFGQLFAELPLIATDPEHRRQGYCRQLLGALISMLAAAGVSRLCLPAASESVGTWKNGFGFRPMDPIDVEWASSELRMLRFPGSEPLQLEIIQGALDKPIRPNGWVPFSARPKEHSAKDSAAIEPPPAGGEIAATGSSSDGPPSGTKTPASENDVAEKATGDAAPAASKEPPASAPVEASPAPEA